MHLFIYNIYEKMMYSFEWVIPIVGMHLDWTHLRLITIHVAVLLKTYQMLMLVLPYQTIHTFLNDCKYSIKTSLDFNWKKAPHRVAEWVNPHILPSYTCVDCIIVCIVLFLHRDICIDTGCKKTVLLNKKIHHFPLTQAKISYSRKNRKK